MTILLPTNLALHELQRILPADDANVAGLLLVPDTIALIRHLDHLRSESRADELTSRLRRLVQHLRDRRTVLRVEVGIDLVEKVERRRIGGLDGEDKLECAQTGRMLVAEQNEINGPKTYSSVHRSTAESSAARRACC